MATLLRIGLVLAVLWGLVWMAPFAQEAPDLKSGLLHWWPDPAEGTDEVTGRKGVRRGFGPLPSDPQARFGRVAGWTELGPGITNTSFTITCWIRDLPTEGPPRSGIVLSQQSEVGDGWRLQEYWGATTFAFFGTGTGPFPPITSAFQLDQQWHFLGVRVTPTLTEVWKDGQCLPTKGLPILPQVAPGILSVGDGALDHSPWRGDLMDLRIHGRALTDSELRSLGELPRSRARTLPHAGMVVVPERVTIRAAEDAGFEISKWTTDHRLPSPHVQSLLQTANGTLWLGFEEGPIRFNGRRFDSVAATREDWDVISMAEQPVGTVWLGLFRDLVRLDGGTIPTVFTNWASARSVRALAAVGKDDLWVATVRDENPRGRPQLWRMHGREGRAEWMSALPASQIRHLWQGREALWIATDEPSALWRQNPDTEVLELVVHFSGDDGDPGTISEVALPSVRIASGVTDSEARVRVWMESPPGAQWSEVSIEGGAQFVQWRRNSGADWRFTAGFGIPGSWQTRTGSAGWFSTTRGLLHFDGTSWMRVPLGDGSGEADVESILPNHEGGLWVASKAAGLKLVQQPMIRVLGTREGIAESAVESVSARFSGELLVGAHLNHVRVLDWQAMTATPLFPHRPDAGGLCAQFPDGRIAAAWVVTEGGPEILGRDRVWRLVLSHADGSRPSLSGCSQIHVARDETLWLVTDRRLYQILEVPGAGPEGLVSCIEGNGFRTWTLHPDRNLHLIGIAEDASGGIWVGSGGHGLFQIRGTNVTHFPDPDTPPDRLSVPLGFSPDGTLWLGSEAGLGVFRNGRSQWVRPEDGLPEAVVCDVEEAEGHLWFAGRRGIHAVPRRELEAFLAGSLLKVSAISLAHADGFPRGQVSLVHQPAMAKTSDGRLWVGTTGGLAVLDPREVLGNLHPPPVAIDRIASNGESQPFGTRRTVLSPGGGRVVELAFSSLSFHAPERVEFEYLVTGPETSIRRQTPSPYAVLTHLGPGHYTAQVRARSGHGLVSDPPARLEFEIQPRLTETGWFRMLATGLSGAMVLGLFSLRIQRIRRTARVEQELRLNTERRRIAKDMHDELGAELTRMALRVRGLESEGSPTSPADKERGFRGLLRVLDEIVWVVNPSKDSLESVVGYLEAWVRDFFSETRITIRTELPPRIPTVALSSEWRHHLLRIVKECCRNVLQHAGATLVLFDFRSVEEGRAILMEVRDNGRGFQVPEDGEGSTVRGDRLGGNGLPNLRDRARQLGGELEVVSIPGQGACIRLRVPLPGITDRTFRSPQD